MDDYGGCGCGQFRPPLYFSFRVLRLEAKNAIKQIKPFFFPPFDLVFSITRKVKCRFGASQSSPVIADRLRIAFFHSGH